jgi:predicted ATP-binding protein involved in virulence
MTTKPKKATTISQPAASDSKAPPVYFLSMEVENALCFKDKQRLDLSDSNGKPAQWTVILGNNGVGKTTILRCLAGMEMRAQKSSLENYTGIHPLLLSPRTFLDRWQDILKLQLEVAQVRVSLVSINSLSEIKNFKSLELRRYDTEVEIGRGFCFTRHPQEFEELICYGYGATRRMGETSLSDKFHSTNSESLFSDNASLINAEEWLLQTDYAARSASGKTRDRLQKQLNQIIEVLKRILPDVEDIHIAPADEEHDRPRAEFKTPYGWVSLSSLGLGYRTTIAWMVDLAVRLFQRYPDSKDPLAEPAIVLVDEIDLHMHPTWQRTIMEFLTERFPNTQFIVTAHSPLVVQAAKDANIVLLRREGDRVIIDNNPEIIDNWRVDQVLTSVFELPSTRPANLDPLLKRRHELLSKAKLTKKDEAELRELNAKIGSMPTAETPDDIKAMDIIRRAAKLLENSQAGEVE